MTGPICRRSLFGAPAGLLLLAAPAAGPAKAAELDGELIALTARLEAIEAEADAFPAVTNERWHEFDAVLDRYWDVADEIVAIPARTPEGIQCKARVLRSVRAMLTSQNDDAISQHMLGLIGDLLGEAGA